MTTEERTKARLIKAIGETIVEGRYGKWHWHGTEYTSFGWCGTCGIEAFVRFTANFRSIRAEIETEQRYSVPNSVQIFEGDDAMTEAVKWTADKLYELYKTVSERTAPFVSGHNAYLKAVQGVMQ